MDFILDKFDIKNFLKGLFILKEDYDDDLDEYFNEKITYENGRLLFNNLE